MQVSGVSNEIFRQIEMVENDHDGTTAAALEVIKLKQLNYYVPIANSFMDRLAFGENWKVIFVSFISKF